MRRLKKWSCLLLALLMLPALAACGKKQQPDSDASQNEVQDTDTPQDSTPTEEQIKVLVVYFSATGSTKAVAGYIAETLGADTFELTPQEPYLAADLDYNNSESRVCREHADPALQDVALTSTAVESWERYDTVFVGYPIWWGGSAWPVNGFVKANDFTRKDGDPLLYLRLLRPRPERGDAGSAGRHRRLAGGPAFRQQRRPERRGGLADGAGLHCPISTHFREKCLASAALG